MLVRSLQVCEEFMAGDGSLLRELLHPDKAPVGVRYSLAHARVGRRRATKRHRLESAEVYYLLGGEGVMHIDGEKRAVRAGDTIYIPPGAIQHIENPGEADLVFLCIVDPAWQEVDEVILQP
jgi:mannose-6-phosphate isomerase-like protein (cupin superfamily)